MPILPFYAEDLGADALQLGLILAGYAAAQFAFAPTWGRLSDRIGRRSVLILTVSGTSLSLLALGLASSLLWIFAARVLGGAFAANVSVASAYITDVTSEEERTRWMGLLGASFGVGFVLGPAIGGLLAPYGTSVPMLAASGLAAANALYAAAVLREPPRHADAGPAGLTTRLQVLRHPLVRRLCLAYLGFSLAVTVLESLFAFLMLHRFGWQARPVAFLLVAMAVVMGGIQGGGLRALSARFPERGLVRAGTLLLGASFVAIAWAPSVWILLVPLFFAAVGRAISQPSLMSLASFSAEAGSRGVVLGTFQSSASLARVVGPVLAGALYDRAIPLPFLAAALLLFAVAAASGTLPERKPST